MAEFKKVIHFTFKLPFNFNKDFLTELTNFKGEFNNSGSILQTKNPLWDYKKVTTAQEYWNDKGFRINMDLEPLWQRYMSTVVNCPQTNFTNHLSNNPSGYPDYPDRWFDLYNKIWFETRNTIFQ